MKIFGCAGENNSCNFSAFVYCVSKSEHFKTSSKGVNWDSYSLPFCANQCDKMEQKFWYCAGNTIGNWSL